LISGVMGKFPWTIIDNPDIAWARTGISRVRDEISREELEAGH